jgi:hypothetical protein
MTPATVRVLTVSGSLRAVSSNGVLLDWLVSGPEVPGLPVAVVNPPPGRTMPTPP